MISSFSFFLTILYWRKQYFYTILNKEANEFVEKLNAGLELAEKRMLQEKSKRGESVVIYTEDKGIQHIPASIVIANNNIFQN